MSILQNLKAAKGLGSGRNGTHHFIVQRTVSVILIPLVIYFFYAIIAIVGVDNYAELKAWFSNPLHMGLLSAFAITGFYQSALGLQVVIEDYVHHELTKYLALIAVKGSCLIGGLIAVVSILRLGLSS